jgi:TatD DNase family protein
LNFLVDTHCHLDFPEFSNDLDAVLDRASAAGIEKIISIGTSLSSSRKVVQFASRYPNVFATVGVHPNSVRDDEADFINELRDLAQHPKVVAIGETGLDFYRLPETDKRNVVETAFGSMTTETVEIELKRDSLKAAQSAAFELQLELAAELQKPVVIHQRDSWDDTLSIIRQYQVPAVFHCFTGGVAELNELLALGYLVSFTGIITFKSAGEIREAVKAVPSDRIMLETDAPYLAPIPHRGKRCEPAFVRETAERIAAERQTTFDELAGTTTENALRFFGIQ